MSSSIFLRNLEAAAKSKDVVVSFLFYEILHKLSDENPDEELGPLVATALHQSGQLSLEEAATDSSKILSAVEKMRSDREAVTTAASKTKSGKRQYGTQFVSFFDGLSPQDKCLFAADYDFDKAGKLYCNTDRNVACEIIKAKFNFMFEASILDFEGTVFGMGGSFNGRAGSGEVNEIDSTEMSDAEKDASAKAFMRDFGRF